MPIKETSFPFLRIAREGKIDYGEVCLHAWAHMRGEHPDHTAIWHVAVSLAVHREFLRRAMVDGGLENG